MASWEFRGLWGLLQTIEACSDAINIPESHVSCFPISRWSQRDGESGELIATSTRSAWSSDLNSSRMLKLWLKPFWQLLVPGIFWEQTLHHSHCGWIRLALAIKVLQSPARNWLPWEHLCNLRHHDLVFPISFHNVSERITTFCEEKSRKPHPSESPFLTYSLYALYFQFMSVFSFDGNALSSLAPKSVFFFNCFLGLYENNPR